MMLARNLPDANCTPSQGECSGLSGLNGLSPLGFSLFANNAEVIVKHRDRTLGGDSEMQSFVHQEVIT